jgi:hypothetical protein
MNNAILLCERRANVVRAPAAYRRCSSRITGVKCPREWPTIDLVLSVVLVAAAAAADKGALGGDTGQPPARGQRQPQTRALYGQQFCGRCRGRVDPAHVLPTSPAAGDPGHIAACLAAHAQDRLAQLDAALPCRPIEPFDAAHEQVAVSGTRDRLDLDVVSSVTRSHAWGVAAWARCATPRVFGLEQF